ncbi:MAG: Gfo/Idh/MocA family oxidoreductase [Dictyoglomus sp.]|nr:Gfo/Idh/MocA family oxidoreductase [Dictyoglomus sp.]MDW8188908.1 Gfo/Idh/MocA family oxidoreductase [Dictyoglomus sp.]
MRICIIGSSGHINYVIEGVKKDKECKIIGVAPGSKEEKIDKVLNMIDNKEEVQIFDNYIEMLDKLHPDIAVSACHFGNLAKVNMEALKRGINVFSEKPVATTFEDLEKLKEIYKSSKRHFCAMFGIRYKPWFLTAWKRVKEGAVGEVRLINTQKSYKLGKRDEFYKKRESFGGTIPWVGIHAIDWIYWFTGKKFKSVYAVHSKKYNKDHGDLETTALCQFTLEDEVFASLSIDYLRPESALSHDDDRLRIVGTEGVIEVIWNKVFLINKEYGGEELPLLPEGNIFLDFIKEIRGEGKCMISAEDSFYITEIALWARQSADEGKIIYL